MSYHQIRLDKSATLGRAWRAGVLRRANETEEINFQNICNAIDRCLDPIADRPMRLPLADISKLVYGSALLYSAEADSLLKHCSELDMAIRKRRSVSSVDSLNDSSEYSENMISNDSRRSTSKRRATLDNSQHEKRRRYTGSSGSSKERYQSLGDLISRHSNDGNTEVSLIGFQSSESIENREELSRTIRTTETGEIGVQANINMSEPRDINEDNFDENLPFGVFLYYNKHSDRIPSKVIIGSCTEH